MGAVDVCGGMLLLMVRFSGLLPTKYPEHPSGRCDNQKCPLRTSRRPPGRSWTQSEATVGARAVHIPTETWLPYDLCDEGISVLVFLPQKQGFLQIVPSGGHSLPLLVPAGQVFLFGGKLGVLAIWRDEGSSVQPVRDNPRC